MLGRLLHLGTASGQPQNNPDSSKLISTLESVQEDLHTRNLLFPDSQTLLQQRYDQVFPLSPAPATPTASTPPAFDYGDDLDLDVKDVRVLIMQDTLGPTHTSLLFDSHPPPAVPTSPTSDRSPLVQDSRRTTTSSRKGSTTLPSRPPVTKTDSPPVRQGAFDRRGSQHGRTQSKAETEAQRAVREHREELGVISGCIFGQAEIMAYKGTSTKVHMMTPSERSADHPASSLANGRSSIGRSSTRSSKLSQSYSSQANSPGKFPSLNTSNWNPRTEDCKKVLITRLFPVNISDEADNNITPQSRLSEDSSGFPFPLTSDDAGIRKKKPQPKQRRTPMYAVVLVVKLAPPRVSHLQPKSVVPASSSYNDNEFLPSSYGSARFSGMSMSGSGVFGDGTDSFYSTSPGDRMDSLAQHWDVVMRSLTHLQSVVATTIHGMLKQVDITSPGPATASAVPNYGPRSPPFTERRSLDTTRAKPPKSTTKLVSLWPNCLANDAKISEEVSLARSRIVQGLGATRVVTGQGRWGIWRDEAIWVSRWTSSLHQEQFFPSLLTGFLATHTDWVQALCPASYRRRIFHNSKSRSEEDLSLPSRTVIIANDKMAARRLIFLLSAFLPANQQLPGARPHRPSTAASLGGYAESPPKYVIPVLREESLRRKLNRRSGLRRASQSRAASQPKRASGVPPQLAHLTMGGPQDRRASDAGSIRTAHLPMTGHDFVNRKSSAATTTTIVPETTMPHFSSVQRVDSYRRLRHESVGSIAADDLKRSLTRGDSSSQLSSASNESRNQGLRWGSLMSGLWSPRRRESTDLSSMSQTSDQRSPVRSSFSRGDRLSEMVREVSLQGCAPKDDSDTSPKSAAARDVTTPKDQPRPPRGSFAQADRTPDPNGAFESPVKTSINQDGIIDVDVPFPDYITSFESAISSPSSSGYPPTPGLQSGLESFEQSARPFTDEDLPLNVAGWLDHYHPDFAMQAIPPREDAIEKIKESLRAEPTPPGFAGESDTARWVDVGSVMVADTNKFSITRISYRRLVKPKSHPDRQAGPASANVYANPPLTPSILPYETPLEEEWIEEPVMRADDLLNDAMDKVINLNIDSGKDSLSSSSTENPVRASTDSGGTTQRTLSDLAHSTKGLDIPRVQCRTIMLSSLEETVREVIDSRDEEQGRSKPATKFTSGLQQSLLRDSVKAWARNLDGLD